MKVEAAGAKAREDQAHEEAAEAQRIGTDLRQQAGLSDMAALVDTFLRAVGNGNSLA